MGKFSNVRTWATQNLPKYYEHINKKHSRKFWKNLGFQIPKWIMKEAKLYMHLCVANNALDAKKLLKMSIEALDSKLYLEKSGLLNKD